MTEGRCIGCESTGKVGDPCHGRVCAKLGYHFVPGKYFSSANASRKRDRIKFLGTRIDDYLVVDRIGGGGFATVYLALQLPLLMECALKLMHYTLDEPEGTERLFEKFQGEAHALALLRNPHIVRLIKFGTVGKQPFIVMEYVKAPTLSDEIRRRAKAGNLFTPAETAHIISQILFGLEAAHKEGIVHRDIKPGNILLQEVPGNPRLVRIVDFGLAKFLAQGTRTRLVAGTPHYMAPELRNNEEISPASDLYSVAVILFEMLTGYKPFRAETRNLETARDPERAAEFVRFSYEFDGPPELEAFIRRGVAPNPAERIQSAAEFREELARVIPPGEGNLSSRAPAVSGVEQGFSSRGRAGLTVAVIAAVLVSVTAIVWTVAHFSTGAGGQVETQPEEGTAGPPPLIVGTDSGQVAEKFDLSTSESPVVVRDIERSDLAEQSLGPFAPDVSEDGALADAGGRGNAPDTTGDIRFVEGDETSDTISDLSAERPGKVSEPATNRVVVQAPPTKKRPVKSETGEESRSGSRHPESATGETVEDQVSRDVGKPVRVRLDSTPPRVEIFENEVKIGTTPLFIEVTPGEKRELAFKKERYKTVKQPIDGKKPTVHVTLNLGMW